MEAMASTIISVLESKILVLPFLLLLPLLFLILKHNISKTPPLPPGPYPWPIIGNLLQVGSKPHDALAQLSQAHGPLISLRLGTQLVVVGSSPAAATEIVKTHDRQLSGRHVPHVSYAKNPNRNHLSFAWTFECTDQWKFLRTLCRGELFGTKIMDGQSSLREKKVHEMVQFLSSKEGEMVKIGEVVFVSIFNILGNFFFSKDFIGFDEKLGEGSEGMKKFIRRLMEVWSVPNISDLYPVLGELDLQGLRRKSDECVENICGVWKTIIRERRGNRGGGTVREDRDFLDVLLDNEFSDDQINILFLELFTAGSDTTTSTIEWAMAELIKNPEAMNKIRNELAREIPADHESFIIRESHLPQLSYLHAFVKETLRLHPPAPLLLPRRAIEKCQVMNYAIPKNTKVLVNVWAIGRDPSIWDDPLSFRAERFLHSDLDFKGNDFEFLPFGGGRKICPGLPMAVRQVHLTLASLIHNFEWSLPNNMLPHQLDMSEKFGITLQKEQPLVLIPKPRI